MTTLEAIKITEMQIVSSIAVLSDPELVLPTEADAVYYWWVVAAFHSPVGGSAPDFQIGVSVSNKTLEQGWFSYVGTTNTSVVVRGGVPTIGSDLDTSINKRSAIAQGFFNTSAVAGLARVQWSPVNVNANAVILLPGTTLGLRSL